MERRDKYKGRDDRNEDRGGRYESRGSRFENRDRDNNLFISFFFECTQKYTFISPIQVPEKQSLILLQK